MTGDEAAGGLEGAVAPAVAVRLVLFGVAVALVVSVIAGRDVPVWWTVLLIVLAAGAAITPGTLVPGVLLALLVTIQLMEGTDDLGVRVAVTAVLFYAVHVLAALAAVVPAAGRVELAALWPSAWRAAAVLGISLVLGVVTAVVPAEEAPAAVLIVLAGAAAVLVCAPAVVARRAASGSPTGRRDGH